MKWILAIIAAGLLAAPAAGQPWECLWGTGCSGGGGGTPDDDSVGADQMADEDHGNIEWDTGVAYVSGMDSDKDANNEIQMSGLGAMRFDPDSDGDYEILLRHDRIHAGSSSQRVPICTTSDGSVYDGYNDCIFNLASLGYVLYVGDSDAVAEDGENQIGYRQECVTIEDPAAGRTLFMHGKNVIVTKGWCECEGTCTGPPTVKYEEEGGADMTMTAMTCSTAGTVAVPQTISAANALLAFENLQVGTVTGTFAAGDMGTFCWEWGEDH